MKKLNADHRIIFMSMKQLSTLLLVFCVSYAGYSQDSFNNTTNQRVLTNQQWLEDLEFALAKLEAIHPNRYQRISQEDFARVAGNARSMIEHSKSDDDCYFAIRHVIASIQDAHTMLFFGGMVNYRAVVLPVKIDYLADGYFIGGIEKGKKELLGARILAINDTPMDSIVVKMQEIVSHDNLYSGFEMASRALRYPLILKGIGVKMSGNEFTFSVLTLDGKPVDVKLIPANSIQDSDLFTVQSLLDRSKPLHLKNLTEDYWFEYLSNDKLVYAQINRVERRGEENKSFSRFTGDFFKYFDQHAEEIGKVIIDLRFNPGGQGRLTIPFIKEMVKRENHFPRGKLFVLIGSKTYSAGVVFATQFLEYTNAIFVGSPSGCAANMFSNSNSAGKLPNSRYELDIASRQIENTWIANRNIFKIDVPAIMTGKDYYTGSDPALEAIVKGEIWPLEDLAALKGADEAFRRYNEFKKKYADLNWWNTSENLETTINDKGYALIAGKEIEKATQVFMLNTLIFPSSANAFDSLGEAFMLAGNKESAIKHYEKSLALNPQNTNALEQLKQLKEIK